MFIKYLFGIFLLLIISCNDDVKDVSIKNNFLICEWVLTETYISPGGAIAWEDVDEGYKYVFKNNGLFHKLDFNNSIQLKRNISSKGK